MIYIFLCKHPPYFLNSNLGEEPYIVLGSRSKIERISLDGSKAHPVINNTDYDIIGVDYDIRSVCHRLRLPRILV